MTRSASSPLLASSTKYPRWRNMRQMGARTTTSSSTTRTTSAESGLVSSGIQDLTHLSCQCLARKGFLQEVFGRIQGPLPSDGRIRVSGKKERPQPRTLVAETLGGLNAVHLR